MASAATTITEPQTIDLLIAADSPMECQLLKGALEHSCFPFSVVASALSKAEILRSTGRHSPDVALISDTLQDGPATDFGILKEIRNAFPNTKVVLLLKAEREEFVVNAFRAGVRGVFHRSEPLQTLAKCIQAVQQGQIWANSSQLRLVLDAFANALSPRLINSEGRILLTKREDEVVRLVVEGASNREVAEKLGLTEHTVSNYLFRIYEKLGISTRVELVLYALKAPDSY